MSKPARPSITLYSKPQCVQCNAVKRTLNKTGMAYDVIDMSQDADALDKVKALGYAQAPVVIWTDRDGLEHHFSGFRPDAVKEIITDSRAVAA